MTPLNRAEYAYRNDPRYKAVVELLAREITDLQLTPAEVRELAVFACVLVEHRRPPQTVFTEDPCGVEVPE